MNIFVLEDDPMRLRWFRQRFLGHTLTVAESCAQVDRFQPPYDLILLDHDLGGRVYQDHEDCGETFARDAHQSRTTPWSSAAVPGVDVQQRD